MLPVSLPPRRRAHRYACEITHSVRGARRPSPGRALPPRRANARARVPPGEPIARVLSSLYPDVCIPPPPPDVDCNDIPFRTFRVLTIRRGIETLLSVDAPSISVRLRKLCDLVGLENHLDIAWGNVVPNDLLDVVGAVECVGCSLVAVPLLAVRCTDD
jgi:hypothetical protein